jgi:hypothetical protein
MKELSEKRLAICKRCPIYSENTTSGPTCTQFLYINPKTEDVSFKQKEGYVRGCGCKILSKIQSPDAGCPIDKW